MLALRMLKMKTSLEKELYMREYERNGRWQTISQSFLGIVQNSDPTVFQRDYYLCIHDFSFEDAKTENIIGKSAENMYSWLGNLSYEGIGWIDYSILDYSKSDAIFWKDATLFSIVIGIYLHFLKIIFWRHADVALSPLPPPVRICVL